MTQTKESAKKIIIKNKTENRVIPKRSEESTQPNLSLSNFNNAKQKTFFSQN